MSEADRQRWNERYRAGGDGARSRSPGWAAQWLDTLVAAYPGGRALDLACGRGRHAILLARSGFEVDAVDISDVAIGHARRRAARLGVDVGWRVADLDDAALEVDAYDVVVVSRFLNRERLPDLVDALRPGGTIVYEQHVVLDHRIHPGVSVGGPRTSAYRLRPNELLRWFLGLHVRHYEEGPVRGSDGAWLGLARLVATRPGA